MSWKERDWPPSSFWQKQLRCSAPRRSGCTRSSRALRDLTRQSRAREACQSTSTLHNNIEPARKQQQQRRKEQSRLPGLAPGTGELMPVGTEPSTAATLRLSGELGPVP